MPARNKAARNKSATCKAVETLKHDEAKRKNIPSAEQQSIVQKEHEQPKTIRYPPEKEDDLVRMNGGAILYGAAREMVMNLTARSKHGPFELPTIDARMFLKKPGDSTIMATETHRQGE